MQDCLILWGKGWCSRPSVHSCINLSNHPLIRPSIYFLIYPIIQSSVHLLRQRIWPVIPASWSCLYPVRFLPPAIWLLLASPLQLQISTNLLRSTYRSIKHWKNICLCLAVPPGPSLVRLFPVHPIGQSVPISSCLSFVHLSEDKCSIAIMLAHHHLAVYLLSFFHLFLPVFPLCRSLSLSNSRSGHPSISAISHNMACLGTGQESEISSHII